MGFRTASALLATDAIGLKQNAYGRLVGRDTFRYIQWLDPAMKRRDAERNELPLIFRSLSVDLQVGRHSPAVKRLPLIGRKRTDRRIGALESLRGTITRDHGGDVVFVSLRATW